MLLIIKVLNILGFISAIFYTLVPSVFLYVLFKFSALQEESLSILGILFLYINALIYFVRRMVDQKDIDVRDFCNLAGAYLGFIYLVLYIKFFFYKTEKNKFWLFIILITVSSIIVIIFELFTKKKEKVTDAIEWIGIIFNILEYLPIGFNLIYLLKNKISQRFTLLGAVCGLINTIIWLIWAIIYTINEKDKKIHSIIANIFGMSLCIFQIVIYYLFKKDDITPLKQDDNKATVLSSTKDENDKNKNENENEQKDKSEIEDFI